MARHRSVRGMNYDEEYEGYFDVYGHSVEEDYCGSPSMDQYMYDRSKQPDMSAFMQTVDDIAEEDHEVQDHGGAINYPLDPMEEGKLQSCLDELRSVVGESVSETILIKAIRDANFDIEDALKRVLDNSTSSSAAVSETAPLPQRERKHRDRNRKEKETDDPESKAVALEKVREEIQNMALSHGFPGAALKVVAAKTSKRSHGFDIPSPASDSTPSTPRPYDRLGAVSPASSTCSSRRDDSPGAEKIGTPEETPSPIRAKIKKKVNAQEEYQKERGNMKEKVNLVVIGHVDAGKSTLMGHLLYLNGQVNKKLMHKYEQESKKLGKQSFVYAWVLDETGEERSRGVTMDIGQSHFETEHKEVILLDAPGHKDFIPNMILGAAQADVAILVVDATRGEFETGFESGGQTREHALLVRSLGVSQMAVVVNKLDNEKWSQKRFEEVKKTLSQFLIKHVGFREADLQFLPCSGLTGVNLISRPEIEELRSWYTGPCLLEVIDRFQCPERPVSKPFRMPISDVFKSVGAGFCVAGRIETGFIQNGDKAMVMPQGESVLVKGLTLEDVARHSAFAGDQVVLTLSGIDMALVTMGSVLCDPANPIRVTTKVQARIVLFNIQLPVTKGFQALFHHQSLCEQAVIKRIICQLHKSTGEVVRERPRCLTKNTSGMVVIEIARPVCVELYKDAKELGRFMLRVGGSTVAAGMITEIL
ncbi:unnamed protein product [Darwinula stevensoni]|uniref:Tr-type G domain-containing protein n=1 Tax=Darwinula stevensoni TaxID=69355 RepID=A0A7R8X4Q1_9CRUS|nr:unnamed protein product [Darwinula stevensoni]CAG0879937.1 unnamed protein product [Darwinula stevensoni]